MPRRSTSRSNSRDHRRGFKSRDYDRGRRHKYEDRRSRSRSRSRSHERTKNSRDSVNARTNTRSSRERRSNSRAYNTHHSNDQELPMPPIISSCTDENLNQNIVTPAVDELTAELALIRQRINNRFITASAKGLMMNKGRIDLKLAEKLKNVGALIHIYDSVDSAISDQAGNISESSCDLDSMLASVTASELNHAAQSNANDVPSSATTNMQSLDMLLASVMTPTANINSNISSTDIDLLFSSLISDSATEVVPADTPDSPVLLMDDDNSGDDNDDAEQLLPIGSGSADPVVTVAVEDSTVSTEPSCDATATDVESSDGEALMGIFDSDNDEDLYGDIMVMGDDDDGDNEEAGSGAGSGSGEACDNIAHEVNKAVDSALRTGRDELNTQSLSASSSSSSTPAEATSSAIINKIKPHSIPYSYQDYSYGRLALISQVSKGLSLSSQVMALLPQLHFNKAIA